MSLSIRSLVLISTAGAALTSAALPVNAAFAANPYLTMPARGSVAAPPFPRLGPVYRQQNNVYNGAANNRYVRSQGNPTRSFPSRTAEPSPRRSSQTPSREETWHAPLMNHEAAPARSNSFQNNSMERAQESRAHESPLNNGYRNNGFSGAENRGNSSYAGERNFPHADHYSPMSPAAAGISGSHVDRSDAIRIHYGQNGSAEMRYNYGGNFRPYYSQGAYGPGGFRREYFLPGCNESVARLYFPVAWGNSGYNFYGYQPTYNAAWSTGSYFQNQFYPGGFYSWFYTYSWSASYVGYQYNWSWQTQAWWSYYTAPSYAYFYVYPTYVSAGHWLTDWYFGNLLSEHYALHRDSCEREKERRQERQEARQEAREQARDRQRALDFETKELIRAQVEQAVRENESREIVTVTKYISTTSTTSKHVYVVSEDTPVITVKDSEHCTLSHADIIQQADQVDEGQQTINVRVIQSKDGSCEPNKVVQIDVSQLQEFENDLHARVELGLQEMNTSLYQK